MLCRHHHRAVYEESYQVERLADGALRLDGQTLCPSALWERLDVGWAIDVLHSLAVGQQT